LNTHTSSPLVGHDKTDVCFQGEKVDNLVEYTLSKTIYLAIMVRIGTTSYIGARREITFLL
jgi:hypothetical protein